MWTVANKIAQQLARIARALEDLVLMKSSEEDAFWACKSCDCSTNHYLTDKCKVCGIPK